MIGIPTSPFCSWLFHIVATYFPQFLQYVYSVCPV